MDRGSKKRQASIRSNRKGERSFDDSLELKSEVINRERENVQVRYRAQTNSGVQHYSTINSADGKDQFPVEKVDSFLKNIIEELSTLPFSDDQEMAEHISFIGACRTNLEYDEKQANDFFHDEERNEREVISADQIESLKTVSNSLELELNDTKKLTKSSKSIERKTRPIEHLNTLFKFSLNRTVSSLDEEERRKNRLKELLLALPVGESMRKNEVSTTSLSPFVPSGNEEKKSLLPPLNLSISLPEIFSFKSKS